MRSKKLVWLNQLQRSCFREDPSTHHQDALCWNVIIPPNTWLCRVMQKGKKKLQAYSLISSLSSDFYIFTPWSLNLFISMPFQFHGEHTVLHPFRHIELVIHIAISVLPGSLLILTWVKWSIWGFSVLPEDTTSKQCPNFVRGETWYFSQNPAPSGIWNRTAGSDIGIALAIAPRPM